MGTAAQHCGGVPIMSAQLPVWSRKGTAGTVLVDDNVAEWAIEYRWLEVSGYVVRWSKKDSGTVALHREILGLPRRGSPRVRFRNGDKRDCRRANLLLLGPVGDRAILDGTTARLPIYRRDGTVKAWTTIDAADLPTVGVYRWHLANGYARRDEGFFLHRQLLGLQPGDSLQGDHKDRDRLNNRRSNLRVVTGAENSQNVPGRAGTSRERGVSWDKRERRWRAVVRGRELGRFETEEEAIACVRAYRRAHMPNSID